MLTELNVDYAFRFVDVWKGEQFSKELSELNPIQKMPIIIDDHDGQSEISTIFESGAILIYLGEKYSMFLPKEGRERYQTIQWLMVQMSSVGPSFGQFNHFRRYVETPNEYAEARFEAQTRNLYRQINDRLGKARYLAGDVYSIADISMFPWFRTMSMFFDGPSELCRAYNAEYPNIWRWYDEVLSRTGVADAVAFIKSMKSTAASATNEDRDRFFQRGNFSGRPIPTQ
ncbi:glutathione S-transferase C-terminal domain-containing protein [Ochrobactrum sp. Q0168]|nr:glutathione S-transferase C-terminal domain-containing protein [Ochrobactrum sp. Q0168]